MFAVLPVAKLGVSVLAGIPVSKITNDIIRNNVTVVTKVDQIKVATGCVVIGAMVAKSVSEFTDNLFDEAVATVKSIRNSEASEEPADTQE